MNHVIRISPKSSRASRSSVDHYFGDSFAGCDQRSAGTPICGTSDVVCLRCAGHTLQELETRTACNAERVFKERATVRRRNG
jgi:hypothetical protein